VRQRSGQGPHSPGHRGLPGIGTLIDREIAKQGVHVVLTGRSAAGLQAVPSGLATACADVPFVPADLSQPGAVKALVAAIERQRRGIDLLASNVGGLWPSTLVVDEGRAAT
jgi:short-subunit dehydrogenase